MVMRNFNPILILALSIPGYLLAEESAKVPCCGVKISGYVDGSYNYLASANQFISGNYDRAFDIEENGFTLHQIAGTVAYQPENGFGGLVNPIIGRDARTTGSYGYNPNNGTTDVSADVLQIFAQYAKGPFTLIAGKFVTLVGVETIDPTSDVNFSRSLLFTFATPNTHTGLRGSYAWNDKLKFILGVNDGWDNIRDTSRDKTLEYGIAYNPNEKWSLSAQGYSGEERVVPRTSTGSTGQRNLIDLIASYNATDKLILAVNFDYGSQNNAQLLDGSSADAIWSGIAGYGNYKFNDTWRLSLRGEIFDDRNGYRTGVDQTIKELTLTIGCTPLKNLEFRAETRRDFSNQFSYQDKDDLSLRKTQQSFGLEVVYKFSNTQDSTPISNSPVASVVTADSNKQIINETPIKTEKTSDKDRFTVQLLGAFSQENVKKFIQQYNLENNAYIATTKRKGKDWYVIVYGDYPSRQAAKLASQNLPASVKNARLKPWVRSIKDVQAEIDSS